MSAPLVGGGGPILGKGNFVTSGNTGTQVILERADCMFCCIAAMDMGGGQLERYIVLSESLFHVGRTLIVEDM